jgi:hypothetical protein
MLAPGTVSPLLLLLIPTAALAMQMVLAEVRATDSALKAT